MIKKTILIALMLTTISTYALSVKKENNLCTLYSGNTQVSQLPKNGQLAILFKNGDFKRISAVTCQIFNYPKIFSPIKNPLSTAVAMQKYRQLLKTPTSIKNSFESTKLPIFWWMGASMYYKNQMQSVEKISADWEVASSQSLTQSPLGYWIGTQPSYHVPADEGFVLQPVSAYEPQLTSTTMKWYGLSMMATSKFTAQTFLMSLESKKNRQVHGEIRHSSGQHSGTWQVMLNAGNDRKSLLMVPDNAIQSAINPVYCFTNKKQSVNCVMPSAWFMLETQVKLQPLKTIIDSLPKQKTVVFNNVHITPQKPMNWFFGRGSIYGKKFANKQALASYVKTQSNLITQKKHNKTLTSTELQHFAYANCWSSLLDQVHYHITQSKGKSYKIWWTLPQHNTKECTDKYYKKWR